MIGNPVPAPIRRKALFLLLLLLLLVGGLSPAGAQEASFSAYWTYDAPGPISLVATLDTNGDGIDETAITTRSYDLILLSATGRALWSYTTPNQAPILQLAVVNVDGQTNARPELLLVTADQLILLDSEGREVWQARLEFPALPTAALTGNSQEVAAYREQLQPIAAAAFDGNQDGNEQILLLLRSGLLQLYSASGEWLWTYQTVDPPAGDAQAHFAIGDADRDGQSDIAFTYFGGRFSRLALVGGDGQNQWPTERPVDGRATALAMVDFDPNQPQDIAVGNSLGRVHLYDVNGQERWFRTPNKTVTSLAMAALPQGRALLVGTEVGTVAAYDAQGDRYWRAVLPDTPNRSVTSLSPSPGVPRSNQPAVAVTLTRDESESAEVYLLNSTGRVLQDTPLISVPGATSLVDINRDGINELLLVSFGTLALTDSGTGARKNAPGWDYRLFVAPASMLAADIDQDGKDELLLGASDGRLHLLESDVGTQASWIQKLGDNVPELAMLPGAANEPPLIVAVSTERQVSTDDQEEIVSTLRLLDADGQPVAEAIPIAGTVTQLVVGDANGDKLPDMVTGTAEGVVQAFGAPGDELWSAVLPGRVAHLRLADDGRLLAATGSSDVYSLSADSPPQLLVNYNLRNIVDLYLLPAGLPGEAAILIVVDDGSVRGLTWSGIEVWRHQLNSGHPTVVLPAGSDFFIATDTGQLYTLDGQHNLVQWDLSDETAVSALTWSDLNGGGAHDLAVGNRNGNLYLYSDDQQPWDRQKLTSSIYALAGLQRGANLPAELVAVTDLGVVQLFEAKPNRPPLLVSPQTDARPGSYEISVFVLDEEGDEVQVDLETYQRELEEWVTQDSRIAEGSGSLFFNLSPEGDDPVRYRFYFDDQTHQGWVEPPPGPVPVIINPLLNVVAGPLLVVLVIFSLVVLVRQALTPEGRARIAYNRMKQNSAATLELLDAEYRRSSGSPGLLLNLANRARQEKNANLANLVDGLFLLTARPDAGLPIINSALDQARQQEPPWRLLDEWRTRFRMGQTLLEAPNITELGLLHPQLWQLVHEQTVADQPEIGLSRLARVLASLRDSERVDLAEDRIVYLHEAAVLLRQIREDLAGQPVRIDNRLLSIVAVRWLGLVNAAIEELRGQAQLSIILKTKRLVPRDQRTSVVLELHNKGRAPAENLVIELDPNPAYTSLTPPEDITVLPPGRVREVTFDLTVHELDRFRLACHIAYDDRSQLGRQIAFADMVHLLPPVREFSPIPNPYLPGTPLRESSSLFYGREDLFQFIAQNAGSISQRNVLILVGQRRTGKTSALLRLRTYLPDNLLPVYIDCQSLGVVPGMANLFHDLAWLLADALALRGCDLAVPEPAVWRDDPAGYFQRRFLPEARQLLPAGTTLLLVFDEFEAFENLVNDGILPPTFFTYLRHLMQHSHGLSFVFVGTRRLEEMSTDYWSVLFNIALYRHIGFLSREAAMRLVCEPVAPHIIYDDLALDKIWRVTAGQPYFLQLVCYTLINQANNQRSGYITISDVNAALEDMLRLGEVHFAYIWQRSSYTERALLAAVAHLMDRDVPFHPADLMQYLEQYGFQLDPADVTAGLTRLVEREIMQEITTEGTTYYELKIGLVGLWAAQNKSLSKLYESKNGTIAAPPERARLN